MNYVMTEIRVENLTKRFTQLRGDDIVAVDDISFTLDNEILSLVGPSGCGKTTTLRCIAGLESVTDGDIYFGDTRVNDIPPQERNISMLFQNPALWNNMTVRENIAYGLRIQRYDQAEIEERVADAADLLKITDQLEKNPSELSGGQQQRVAMGRALVQDPDLFLFDEAMSALDAALKEEFRPLVQQIIKEADVPAIYVTHDQEEAMTLSDKIAVMNKGHIEQFGSPQEVYDNPETKFVAEFIGKPSMNFISADVVSGTDGSYIELGELRIPVTDDRQGSVIAGVRPSAVSVHGDGNSEGIDSTHLLDETVGERTYSYFDTEFGEFIAITPAAFDGNGGTYTLSLEEESVHVFQDA